MTLVPPANIMGSNKQFILSGRLLMYTMNSIGPRTDPLGTQCFNPLHLFDEHMYVCEWLMLLVV